MKLLTGVSDAALQTRVLAHYRRTAPLIERRLSGTPIVYANYPAGLDVASPLTVANGTVYVGTYPGTIYAFGLKKGAK